MSKVGHTDSGMTMFMCPGCNDWHGIDDKWTVTGTDDRPTFSPSVLVVPSANGYIKRCHSYVRDGKIEFLADSQHALAGETVELPDVHEVV